MRGTVLVVDDDADILRLVEVNLRARGHHVITAMTGEDALRLTREFRPALVLLDVTMPGINGYEVCRRLRADWRYGDPGIVMLTGLAAPAERTLGLAAGADDFMVKPIDPAELVARVKLTLRRLEEMRSASPLTGLPGNVQIQSELRRRVAAGTPVALLYVDIDAFKAYNDHYGFLRGDEAIEALGEVLRTELEGRPGTFLGHVGGDDFIVLANPRDAEAIGRDVLSAFAARAEFLYDPADAARGWIQVEDRDGTYRRFPLLTVSIGVATNLGREVEDHRVLVDIATEMKQHAKVREGLAVAVDRRTGPAPRFPLGGRLHSRRPSPGAQVSAGRRSRFRRLVLRPVVALLALAFVAGPATMVLAENAAPGDLLWPVKLGVEDLRLMVARDPDAKVALHLEFAARRLGELAPLLADGGRPDLIATVSDNWHGHATASILGLGDVEELSRSELRAEVGAVLAGQVSVLDILVSAACDRWGTDSEMCGGLQDALDASKRVVESVHRAPEPDPGGPQEGQIAEDSVGGDRGAHSKSKPMDPKGKDKGKGHQGVSTPNGTEKDKDQHSGKIKSDRGSGRDGEASTGHGNSGKEKVTKKAKSPSGSGKTRKGDGGSSGENGDD